MLDALRQAESPHRRGADPALDEAVEERLEGRSTGAPLALAQLPPEEGRPAVRCRQRVAEGVVVGNGEERGIDDGDLERAARYAARAVHAAAPSPGNASPS